MATMTEGRFLFPEPICQGCGLWSESEATYSTSNYLVMLCSSCGESAREAVGYLTEALMDNEEVQEKAQGLSFDEFRSLCKSMAERHVFVEDLIDLPTEMD